MMNFAFKMMNFAFKMMFPGSLIPNITGGHTFRLAPVQAITLCTRGTLWQQGCHVRPS